MWILVCQRLASEFFLDFLYFPLWWYSRGLFLHARNCWNLLSGANEQLAPGLWLRNIFVPMYGQYDWEGRFVSFFMRLVNIIGRSVALFLWLLIVMVLFLLWPVAPIVVVYFLGISIIAAPKGH